MGVIRVIDDREVMSLNERGKKVAELYHRMYPHMSTLIRKGKPFAYMREMIKDLKLSNEELNMIGNMAVCDAIARWKPGSRKCGIRTYVAWWCRAHMQKVISERVKAQSDRGILTYSLHSLLSCQDGRSDFTLESMLFDHSSERDVGRAEAAEFAKFAIEDMRKDSFGRHTDMVVMNLLDDVSLETIAKKFRIKSRQQVGITIRRVIARFQEKHGIPVVNRRSPGGGCRQAVKSAMAK